MPAPLADIRRARAFCASARVANLPSVVSNVWLGVVSLALVAPGSVPDLRQLVLLAATACGIYVGANLLNDWHDRDWDAHHRPERALPRGWFKPGTYLACACALIGAGLLCAAAVDTARAGLAALLVAFVFLYTVGHKRHAAAILAMALCRALVPLLAGGGWLLAARGSVSPREFVMLAAPPLAVVVYTAGLSICARHESGPQRSGTLLSSPWLWLPAAWALMTVPLWLAGAAGACIVAGGLPLAVWLGRSIGRARGNPGKRAAAMLAGFPLLDASLILPVYLATAGSGAPDAGRLALLLVPALAFAAGVMLQKRFAAT